MILCFVHIRVVIVVSVNEHPHTTLVAIFASKPGLAGCSLDSQSPHRTGEWYLACPGALAVWFISTWYFRQKSALIWWVHAHHLPDAFCIFSLLHMQQPPLAARKQLCLQFLIYIVHSFVLVYGSSFTSMWMSYIKSCSVCRLSVRLSVRVTVNFFVQIASTAPKMARSRPNLHRMVSRWARIQVVLKVKVKAKGHMIRALLCRSRKSLLLPGKW